MLLLIRMSRVAEAQWCGDENRDPYCIQTNKQTIVGPLQQGFRPYCSTMNNGTFYVPVCIWYQQHFMQDQLNYNRKIFKKLTKKLFFPFCYLSKQWLFRRHLLLLSMYNVHCTPVVSSSPCVCSARPTLFCLKMDLRPILLLKCLSECQKISMNCSGFL